EFGQDACRFLLVIGKRQHRPAENFIQRITDHPTGGGVSVSHPAFQIPESNTVDGGVNSGTLDAQFIKRLPGARDVYEGTQSTNWTAVIIPDKACGQVEKNKRAVLLPPVHLAHPFAFFHKLAK